MGIPIFNLSPHFIFYSGVLSEPPSSCMRISNCKSTICTNILSEMRVFRAFTISPFFKKNEVTHSLRDFEKGKKLIERGAAPAPANEQPREILLPISCIECFHRAPKYFVPAVPISGAFPLAFGFRIFLLMGLREFL